MHKFLLILALAVYSNVTGQVHNSNLNAESLRVKSVTLLKQQNYEEAVKLLSELLERQSELDPNLVPTVYNNMGIAQFKLGQYVAGIENYKKALHQYEYLNKDTLYAQALMNLGIAYKEIGSNSLASKSIYDAIYRFQDLGLRKEEASAYNSLGNLYRETNDFRRSESYIREALKIQREINYQKGVAYSYHGLGRLYLEQKKYAMAKSYFLKSLHLKESLNLHSSTASTLAKLGELYLELADCESAKFYLNKSVEIRKESPKPNRLKIALNNIHLGQIHYSCGAIDMSQDYFLQAINELETLQAKKDLLLAYQGLVKSYEASKKFDLAYGISTKIIELQGELQSIDNRKELARLSIEHDVIGYKREIEFQEFQNDFLKKRNQLFLLASILLTLLLVLIFALFVQNRKRKRKIQVQNEALIRKNEDISTLHGELAHRTNNFFSLIRGMLSMDQTNNTQKLVARQISRIDAMAEVQKHLILEGNKTRVDLNRYLTELLEHSKVLYGANRNLQLTFANNLLERLIVDYEIATRIGIITNELINNSIKHNSKLNSINIGIEITYNQNSISINYSDSGKITQSNEAGKGMKLIESILNSIHGTFQIHESEHMNLTFIIPLNETKGGHN